MKSTVTPTGEAEATLFRGTKAVSAVNGHFNIMIARAIPISILVVVDRGNFFLNSTHHQAGQITRKPKERNTGVCRAWESPQATPTSLKAALACTGKARVMLILIAAILGSRMTTEIWKRPWNTIPLRLRGGDDEPVYFMLIFISTIARVHSINKEPECANTDRSHIKTRSLSFFDSCS